MLPLIPTKEEIEEKAREPADQEGIGRGAVVSEERTGQGTGVKRYWLKRAEYALKAERRNALRGCPR